MTVSKLSFKSTIPAAWVSAFLQRQQLVELIQRGNTNEPVRLSLGQAIGSFVLNRVLCSQYQKRVAVWGKKTRAGR